MSTNGAARDRFAVCSVFLPPSPRAPRRIRRHLARLADRRAPSQPVRSFFAAFSPKFCSADADRPADNLSCLRHATHLARTRSNPRPKEEARLCCDTRRRRTRKATGASLKAAVHRAKPLSRAGVLERVFTLAFSRLVYPQIWEDPVVDMKALEIGPGHEVVAIASGGCNVLSYLTADPARITAVDLNGAHIALGKLKICALQHLPDYEPSSASSAAPTPAPTSASTTIACAARLDPATRAYWDKRPRVRPPAHRRLRPQFLSSRPAWPFPRRGPCARAACTGSTRRSF